MRLLIFLQRRESPVLLSNQDAAGQSGSPEQPCPWARPGRLAALVREPELRSSLAIQNCPAAWAALAVRAVKAMARNCLATRMILIFRPMRQFCPCRTFSHPAAYPGHLSLPFAATNGRARCFPQADFLLLKPPPDCADPEPRPSGKSARTARGKGRISNSVGCAVRDIRRTHAGLDLFLRSSCCSACIAGLLA